MTALTLTALQVKDIKQALRCIEDGVRQLIETIDAQDLEPLQGIAGSATIIRCTLEGQPFERGAEKAAPATGPATVTLNRSAADFIENLDQAVDLTEALKRILDGLYDSPEVVSELDRQIDEPTEEGPTDA